MGRESEPRSGVGLANTRERLGTLYDNRAELVLQRTAEGGTAAMIRLPYHELDASAEAGRG